MRNLLLIARREYLEQVRGRAFRITTVGLPLLFLVLLGVGSLANRRSSEGKHVTVAANDAVLAGDVRRQLLESKRAQFTVDVVAPASEADRADLLRQVQRKSIDGFLWIETSPSAATTATYTSGSSGDSMTTMRLREALNRGMVEQRLTGTGMKRDEAEALLKPVPIVTERVNKNGMAVKSNGAAALNTGLIMSFLLTMTTLIYGLDMARSIIEEKASRIFEVMLAVARPVDLLSGKLIGVGAVGLTQITIWIVAAAVIAGSALAAPLLTGDFAIHFSWVEGILFPVYFVLGYFLYSSMFSGLAATCETAQELQMYMPLAAAPVWLSFGITPLLVSRPDSVLAIAASFFPLTAPFVMMLRVGLQMPPAWQFAVSIGLLVVSVWAVLWVSSRLYRVGILMYGKRATLPELMRWLRYS